MFKLVIQDDEGKTTVVPLIRDEITIGRKEGNTIRLTERNVSRRHARIQRTNGFITIEDLDSYNGIKVNGARIDGKTKVSETDRVQIGDYLIEVRREGQESVDTISDEAETKPIPTTTAPMASLDSVDPLATTPIPEQPTIPVTAAPREAPAAAPRVVILSSNFAGQEWSLDRPRMVIGRTDENDIWINHRSISRHHAELVEENGRWSIVDLQSSNGVRVNGEDYGKVELRRGDIVDLGHVRLRFVEAGEDFVFGRDAQAVDIAGPKGGRSSSLLLVIALLVGGGLAAFFIMSQKEKPTEGTGDNPAVVADARPAMVASIDAGHAMAATIDASAEVGPGVALAETLQKAREAVAGESWVEAERLAKEALRLEPDNTEASAIEQKALLEKPNLVFYDEFRQQATADNPKYGDAVMLFNKISEESVYKERARADFDRLKTQYIRRVVEQGQDLATKKACAALRKLAVSAGKVFPDAEAAVRAIRCAGKAAGGTTGTTGGTQTGGTQTGGTTVKPPPNGGGTTTTAPEELDIDATLQKARAAAMRNQWGAARNACEAILKQQPGNVDARSLCLLAACSLKRATAAKRHYERLPASRKAWAVQQCFNQGVEIEE